MKGSKSLQMYSTGSVGDEHQQGAEPGQVPETMQSAYKRVSLVQKACDCHRNNGLDNSCPCPVPKKRTAMTLPSQPRPLPSQHRPVTLGGVTPRSGSPQRGQEQQPTKAEVQADPRDASSSQFYNGLDTSFKVARFGDDSSKQQTVQNARTSVPAGGIRCTPRESTTLPPWALHCEVEKGRFSRKAAPQPSQESGVRESRPASGTAQNAQVAAHSAQAVPSQQQPVGVHQAPAAAHQQQVVQQQPPQVHPYHPGCTHYHPQYAGQSAAPSSQADPYQAHAQYEAYLRNYQQQPYGSQQPLPSYQGYAQPMYAAQHTQPATPAQQQQPTHTQMYQPPAHAQMQQQAYAAQQVTQANGGATPGQQQAHVCQTPAHAQTQQQAYAAQQMSQVNAGLTHGQQQAHVCLSPAHAQTQQQVYAAQQVTQTNAGATHAQQHTRAPQGDVCPASAPANATQQPHATPQGDVSRAPQHQTDQTSVQAQQQFPQMAPQAQAQAHKHYAPPQYIQPQQQTAQAYTYPAYGQQYAYQPYQQQTYAPQQGMPDARAYQGQAQVQGYQQPSQQTPAASQHPSQQPQHPATQAATSPGYSQEQTQVDPTQQTNSAQQQQAYPPQSGQVDPCLVREHQPAAIQPVFLAQLTKTPTPPWQGYSQQAAYEQHRQQCLTMPVIPAQYPTTYGDTTGSVNKLVEHLNRQCDMDEQAIANYFRQAGANPQQIIQAQQYMAQQRAGGMPDSAAMQEMTQMYQELQKDEMEYQQQQVSQPEQSQG